MRKILALATVALLLVGGVALSALWVAMDMRRAVWQGDKAALETRVDWPAVRASLKSSLADLERARRASAEADRPSLWQVIKVAASPARFADRLIDRYVTPEGVASLAAHRGRLKALLAPGTRNGPGEIDIPEHARPLDERAQRFWARLKRLRVTSLTSVDIEIADRRVPERSYLGTIAFTGGRWTLTSLRILGRGF